MVSCRRSPKTTHRFPRRGKIIVNGTPLDLFERVFQAKVLESLYWNCNVYGVLFRYQRGCLFPQFCEISPQGIVQGSFGANRTASSSARRNS